MADAADRSKPTAQPKRRRDQPLVGRRLIRLLEDQLKTLTEQRKHGNRVLRFDHIVVAHLLAFFNPALSRLQPASGCGRKPG